MATTRTPSLKDHLATQAMDGDAVAPTAWLERLSSLLSRATDEDVVAALKDCAGLLCLLGRCLGSNDNAVVRETLRAVRGLSKTVAVRRQIANSSALVTNTVNATTRAPIKPEAFNTLALLATSHANDLVAKTDLIKRVVDALDFKEPYEVRSSAVKLLPDLVKGLSPANETEMLRAPLLLERINRNLEQCMEAEKQGQPKDMVASALRALGLLTIDSDNARLVLAKERNLVSTVAHVARASALEANVVEAFGFLHCMVWAPNNARDIVTSTPAIVELARDCARSGSTPAIKMAALVMLGCLLEVTGNAAQALLGVILEGAKSSDAKVVLGTAMAMRMASAEPRGRELLSNADVMSVMWTLSWSDDSAVRAEACIALAALVDPSDVGRHHLIRDDPEAVKRILNHLALLNCYKGMASIGGLRALRAACITKPNQDVLALSSTVAKLVSVLGETIKRDEPVAARLVCETLLEFSADPNRLATLLRSSQPLHDVVARVVADKAGVVSWEAAVVSATELNVKLQPPSAPLGVAS